MRPYKTQLAFLALIAGTFLLYAPALFYQFIYYDDPVYVFENTFVRSGLSPSFFKWFLPRRLYLPVA